MKLKINGQDFTGCFNRYGVSPSHEKREGPNSGTDIAGGTILDVVSVKAVLDLEANGLNQAQYSALIRLCKLTYVTVTYDDPDTGEEVTRVMIPTAGASTQVPLSGRGNWYKDLTLNLRER